MDHTTFWNAAASEPPSPFTGTRHFGTLRSILRDIEMSPAEFEEAWNEWNMACSDLVEVDAEQGIVRILQRATA